MASSLSPTFIFSYEKFILKIKIQSRTSLHTVTVTNLGTENTCTFKPEKKKMKLNTGKVKVVYPSSGY